MANRIFGINDLSVFHEPLFRGMEIYYYAQPGINYDKYISVLDYNLYFLNKVEAENKICCELWEYPDRYDTLLFNLPKFIPSVQIEYDLVASAYKIGNKGKLICIIPPKSGAKRIQGLLKSIYREIMPKAIKGVKYLECRHPQEIDMPVITNTISWMDSRMNKRLYFCVRPGLFSFKRVDPGTALLLDTISINPGNKILDIGCGYGVIGITAAARGADVEMMDSDSRAIQLAVRNLTRNNLSGTVKLACDIAEYQSDTYDVVLSNPPTHGGSGLLKSLFIDMIRVCKTSGYIALVIREHLNYNKFFPATCTWTVENAQAGYKIVIIRK